jgi:adenosine deaminase
MAEPRLTRALFRSLPKVDLHRHLEGALRLETLWEFHCREKQRLHRSLAALRAACSIAPGERPGFQGFLNRFPGLRFKYGGAEALQRIAAEAVADAAADGVVHLELRFSPIFCALRMKDAPAGGVAVPGSVSRAEAERAAEAVVHGAREEAARRGISVIFIVTMARHFGVAMHRPAAELLHRPIGAALDGLDLAGDESHSAGGFSDFLREWQAEGRFITIHAGEDRRAGGPQNVREALAEWKADRIGHGVRAIEDRDLVRLLARQRVALEMCPTSNVQTRACACFRAHPLKRLLAAGVAATINTDDPAISGTTLSEEYYRAARYCGLNWRQLRACALNAAKAAFLPEHAKAGLAARIAEGWQ